MRADNVEGTKATEDIRRQVTGDRSRVTGCQAQPINGGDDGVPGENLVQVGNKGKRLEIKIEPFEKETSNS
jgi:hypothetical protein